MTDTRKTFDFEAMLAELTEKVNNKFKSNLTPSDVLKIVKTQEKAIPLAIDKGQSVKLPNFGKFTIAKNKANKLPFELIDIQMKYAMSGSNPLLIDDSLGY